MDEKSKSCPICGSWSPYSRDCRRDLTFYTCPVCGRFQLGEYWDERNQFNMNHLAAYLAHNAYGINDPFEHRYHTTVSNEICDEMRKEDRVHPIHMDADIVEAWYPRTFSEKVDHILMYIHRYAPHLGQTVQFDQNQMISFLFLDRYELQHRQYVSRDSNSIALEGSFMLECLVKQGVIRDNGDSLFTPTRQFTLTPEGYARIDAIQKNTANGKNVLVAMKFGEDTKPLREAIRAGISKAGYIAIFIDEVQHNDFITPELLRYIKDSKFVVVDLTHQNNGAYFEEGYAMGLGKAVIQLCKAGTTLHFDIAQKNTIMWKSEEDIPDLLCRRIEASID